jgi:hypothetical protein
MISSSVPAGRIGAGLLLLAALAGCGGGASGRADAASDTATGGSGGGVPDGGGGAGGSAAGAGSSGTGTGGGAGAVGAAGAGGPAGASGAAGIAGAAGTSGSVGTGGAAGAGGSAGAAGNVGAGGSAGTGGVAGRAGSGGVAGGAGTVGAGGSAGAGAIAGRGGSGGAAGTVGTGGQGQAGVSGTAGGSRGGVSGGGTGGSCQTSVSGIVTDPAGLLPIFNAIVYVPSAPLAALPDGVSCDQCGAPLSGQPVAAVLTGADGRFRLAGVPSGQNVPLVIQVGKWRRRVTLPSLTACADNALADPNLTRLPRNQSEGDLPRIAVATGHADALDCFLRRIGISDSEFTDGSGTGRVHLYVGGNNDPQYRGSAQLVSGEVFADAYMSLFSSPNQLARYDMLILACEGDSLESSKLPYVMNIKRYADRGGRIIAEHAAAAWTRRGPPPWPATADWLVTGADLGTVNAIVDTTSPKGAAFSDWLSRAGASTTPGQISLSNVQQSVAGVAPSSQRWLYTTTPVAATQSLTFNAPAEAASANQCGRVAFTDMHIGSGGSLPFPLDCSSTAPLSPQEKALEFMLFDAASCIQSDRDPPVQPGSGSGGGSDSAALVGRAALLIVEVTTAQTAGELALKADLESRGMTVTLAPATAPASMAAGKDLIVVSSNAPAATVAPTFRDVAVPILVFGSTLDEPLGFIPSGSGNVGTAGSATDLTIVSSGTPLVADFGSGAIFRAIVPNRTTSFRWATPGGSPIRVASVVGSPERVIVFGFEKGTSMATGTSAARRAAVGWSVDALPNLSVEAYKLLFAALKWTALAP